MRPYALKVEGDYMASEPLVLGVDDEAGILRLVRLELTAQGFRVITASNGADAMILIEEQRPDIILLDVVMPDLSGFELLRSIRERWRTPVIMVTARDREVDKVRGLAAGADAYVIKRNFDQPRLLSLVEQLLLGGKT